jgi:hypothetical protein
MSGTITFNISGPSLPAISTLLLLILLYVLFALITLGHYIRVSCGHGRGHMGILIRGFIFAAVWPVYWITIVGPVATLSVLSDSISRVRMELLFVYYTLALIFVPAYQIYINWDSCYSVGSCSGAVAKAFLTGLVWPILLVAKIF